MRPSLRKNRAVRPGRGRLHRRAALAALAACALVPGVAAGQDLHSELEHKEAQLHDVREQQGILTTEIDAMNDNISQLEGEVATLRNREAAVEAELARKQAELEQATAELEREKERLRRLRRQLKRALIVLRDRLVAIYQSGEPDAVSVILSSSGWSDLTERTEYLNRIQEQDDAIVNRVRGLRNQSKRTVAHLKVVRARIKAARDAIAAKERELERTRATLESQQAALIAARAERQSRLATLNEREQHLHGDVSDIQAEIAAQLQAVPSAPLPAGPVQQGSSGMIWPVNGPVVSGFGPRWGRMHEGVDIAVPAGTPIRAASSGSVVLLQDEYSSGGYGNFVCLDHGGGLSTCYAHLSSFATSSGASVGQGDVIGYVGCTGHCYGDHLHFEVRVNGIATDPMGYL